MNVADDGARVADVAIALRGVHKVFPGAEGAAVDSLVLDVCEGENVALVGPSDVETHGLDFEDADAVAACWLAGEGLGG